MSGERAVVNIAQARTLFPNVSPRTLYYWMAKCEIEWMIKPSTGRRVIFLDTLKARASKLTHRGPANETAGIQFETVDGGKRRRRWELEE